MSCPILQYDCSTPESPATQAYAVSGLFPKQKIKTQIYEKFPVCCFYQLKKTNWDECPVRVLRHTEISSSVFLFRRKGRSGLSSKCKGTWKFVLITFAPGEHQHAPCHHHYNACPYQIFPRLPDHLDNAVSGLGIVSVIACEIDIL